MIRWIGFAFIVSGAAAVGFGVAANVKRQCDFYKMLQGALAQLKAEIEFRLTPLSEVCKMLSESERKPLGYVFRDMHSFLCDASARPVGLLMRRAIQKNGGIPQAGVQILTELFDVLGKQDVLAQVRAIEYAERRTTLALENIEREKKDRCRMYRTIGVCAGISLAVILI